LNHTPSSGIWEPSIPELLEARVITQVSDGSEFALSEAGGWGDAKQIENELLTIPLFQTLKTHSPETFQKVLFEFGDSTRGENTGSELIARSRVHIDKLLVRHLCQASDDAVIGFTLVITEQLSQLRAKGGERCYAYLSPRSSVPINARKDLSEDVLRSELNALKNVIETAVTDPQPIPDASQFLKEFEPIRKKLLERYGDDVLLLRDLSAPGIDKAKVCEMTIDLYGEILKLPRKDCANLLRYMFSNEIADDSATSH
jgi:hypothetical protein